MLFESTASLQMTLRGRAEKADWPFIPPFFRDRGDTMIAQPSLALESPLLLLLPSVPVAQVRLHSGFHCWLYYASAANGIRSASSSRWKTLGNVNLINNTSHSCSMPLQTTSIKEKQTTTKLSISEARFLPLMGPTWCLAVFFQMVAGAKRMKDIFWAIISCFHMEGICERAMW